MRAVKEVVECEISNVLVERGRLNWVPSKALHLAEPTHSPVRLIARAAIGT
jgi:hypothetical protein